MREIRCHTRIVGAFPDGDSAVMLVAVRLRHIADSKCGVRKYISMGWLKKHELGLNNKLEEDRSQKKCERFLTLPIFDFGLLVMSENTDAY